MDDANGVNVVPFSTDNRKRMAVEPSDMSSSFTNNSSSSVPGGANGSSPPDSSLSEEELRRLISPLSREQMLSLLASYCLVHPDLYAATVDLVQASPASRRLMVRNIAFTTTDDQFRGMFEALGEVQDCTIVKDRSSGKSKGFGFVTFKELEPVGHALKQSFEVDGREWAVKLASDPSGTDGGGSGSPPGRCKLFVRNLSDETTDARLTQEFSTYGPIQEAVVVKDASSGKSKGYGFVTFTTSEDAGKALQISQRVIDGRMTFVSLATPSSHTRGSMGGMNSNMGTGGNVVPMGVGARGATAPQMQLTGAQQQYLVHQQQQQQQLAQSYAVQMQAMQAAQQQRGAVGQQMQPQYGYLSTPAPGSSLSPMSMPNTQMT
eukprot:GHVQ01026599.1.p1 GENE.GHVQ01026599.1~~GHVQ01026599.1.p1  ORF type:complete len:377 (+),score=84.80 GHVQ01026599.1:312-1442(+)